MQLIELIPDLLYRHNCVIIPDFGGFVANFKPSDFKEDRLLSSPAIKRVAFNQNLTENDGLLIQNLAKRRGISYSEAEREVEVFVRFVKDRIANYKNYEFKNIGSLYLNKENKYVFVAYEGLNFYPKSYGLEDVKVRRLQRDIDQQRIKEYRLDKDAPIVEAPAARKLFPWKTIAASFIVLAGFSFMIWQLMGQGPNPLAIDNPPQEQAETASLLPDTESHDGSGIIIEDVTDDVLPERTSDTEDYPTLADEYVEEDESSDVEITGYDEIVDDEVDDSYNDESVQTEEQPTENESFEDEIQEQDESYNDDMVVSIDPKSPAKSLTELQRIRSEHLGSQSVYYIVVARSSDQQVLDKVRSKFQSRSFDAFEIDGTKKGEKLVCVEKFHNQNNAEQFLKLIHHHETRNAEILEFTQ